MKTFKQAGRVAPYWETSETTTGTTTNDHNELINRDMVDQHPMAAITGLSIELNSLTTGMSTLSTEMSGLSTNMDDKLGSEDALTNYDIQEILNM